MTKLLKRATTRLLAMLVSVSLVLAQVPAIAQESATASQPELDRMLAPIALYPDALLSQILMASTYPIEVVQAARWSKQNPHLKGEDAVQAVQDRDWDPSVKALVAFPQILARMDEQLDWTTALGDAFLAQQEQVMETVQGLRQRAHAAGNLSSNEHVRIIEAERTIVIEPAHPRVVYVPWYDPWLVYGTWWWPAHPPVRWAYWHGAPVHSNVDAGIFWGIGVGITVGLLFAAIDWPHRHVKVVHVHHPVYRQRVAVRHAHGGPFVWHHDPHHRRGVAYREHRVRERHVRPPTREFQAPRHAPRAIEPQRQATPSHGLRAIDLVRQATPSHAPRATEPQHPATPPRMDVQRRDLRSEPRFERRAPGAAPQSAGRGDERRIVEPAARARDVVRVPRERDSGANAMRESRVREHSRPREAGRGAAEIRRDRLPAHHARGAGAERRAAQHGAARSPR